MEDRRPKLVPAHSYKGKHYMVGERGKHFKHQAGIGRLPEGVWGRRCVPDVTRVEQAARGRCALPRLQGTALLANAKPRHRIISALTEPDLSSIEQRVGKEGVGTGSICVW